MTTMNITLPEQMKAWVETQAENGRFNDASDYVRDLIRRDQERQGRIAESQRRLDERPSSRINTRALDETWVQALRRARPKGLGAG
jgi:antitoxin ParD1/3/4